MNLKTKDFLFVAVQLVLFIIYLFEIKFLSFKLSKALRILFLITSLIGLLILIVAILQLNKNLSPFPTPKSNSELIQTGLYKYIRHPIYTGILMFTFGYGMYLNSEYKIGISIALMILFYFKSKYEEQRLSKIFSTYDQYKKVTGRFLPKF